MPKRKTPLTPVTALDDASAVEGLTYREELFAHYYVETANAAEAYRRAGGNAKRHDVAAAQMMAKPHVAKRIGELRQRRLAAIQFSAEEILNRLVGQVRADLLDIYTDKGGLKAVHDWPPVWRTGLIAGIEVYEEYQTDPNDKKKRELIGYTKKVKIVDRTAVLKLAGQHVDIAAWKEKAQTALSPELQRMLEHFARDSWMPPLPAAPALNDPASKPIAPAARVVGGVLDR